MQYEDESILSALVEAQTEQKINIQQAIDIDGVVYHFESKILPLGFKMFLPAEFTLMDPELVKRKYLMENRPEYIYTNQDTSVNFCFDLFPLVSTPMWERIEQYQTIIKKGNPCHIMMESDVLQTEWEKEVGYFSYCAPGIDENIYMLVFFADAPEKEIYASFNCPFRKKDRWERPVVQAIQTLQPVLTEG